MPRKRILALAAILLLAGPTLPARAAEVAERARAILKKNQHAVVTVMVVVKWTAADGKSGELKHDATGTVIDSSGLTVISLTAGDPLELRRRQWPEYKVDSEVTDLKILREDGTELPAEIVLRDRDLDLAFIRPKSKPATPMTAVDLADSTTAQIVDEVIALNRLNWVASRAYAISVERISAVVQKPRTFYIPDNPMTRAGLGSPVYSLDGKIIGLFVVRFISGDSTPIILPAEDILRVAKQVPETKAESEKQEDARESKEPKAGPGKP